MSYKLNEIQQKEMNSGVSLPIMEHFYTIQGEGAHTGLASYFIRIGGCDVGCHWCDVKESWEAGNHPIMHTDTLAEIASSHSKTVVLTGGEPLFWNLEILTNKLKSKACTIHLETSGAYELSGKIDWICLSPKKRMLPKKSVIDNANELKCIIYNKHDFKFAEQFAGQVNENCKLYLQPEWSKRESIIPLIVEYVMKNPKWQVSLQTHKYLNIP